MEGAGKPKNHKSAEVTLMCRYLSKKMAKVFLICGKSTYAERLRIKNDEVLLDAAQACGGERILQKSWY